MQDEPYSRQRLLMTVDRGQAFAEHPSSGLTFSLIDGWELWVEDAERVGPVDESVERLLEGSYPGLVDAAREALTAWLELAERGKRAEEEIDYLEAIFALPAAPR